MTGIVRYAAVEEQWILVGYEERHPWLVFEHVACHVFFLFQADVGRIAHDPIQPDNSDTQNRFINYL